MINLDDIKIKDLLRLELNLRELDLVVADQVMKQVVYFKRRQSASINARLVFDTFIKELKDSELTDNFGDLRWTRGMNLRYFTEHLPHYSKKIEAAKLLPEKFPEFKFQLKELDNDLFECKYVHKQNKETITIISKTAPLAICFASLHLAAELEKNKKNYAK
jgi:hypothetical protein